MSDVLISLGDNFFFIPFPDSDTLSFDTVQKDSQFTWIAQQRLGRDPAMQFTGPGEETITIQGRIYPRIFGGISTLDQIRSDGRGGQPQVLIAFSSPDGLSSMTGTKIGNFVILRLHKDNTKISGSGIPHKIDFTLELALYGDDLADNTNVFDALNTTSATTTTNTTTDKSTATTSTTANGSTTQLEWT